MDYSQLDRIYIHDLKIPCLIGINEDERLAKQEIIINITLDADIKVACLSDNIDDTVNYKELKEKIVEHIKDSSYFLIEKLAAKIAEICLENKLVKRAIVKVDKPHALSYARTVSVEITELQKD